MNNNPHREKMKRVASKYKVGLPYVYLERKGRKYWRCIICNNNTNKSHTHCWYCGVRLKWESVEDE